MTSSKISLIAGKVQLGVFEARFGEALLGFEFRNAGSLFENGPAIGGAAAQDLADASLLDERVGLGAEAGAHEQFLNVAQAAEFAVEQVFAVAGAEQAARDRDLSVMELLLVKLAAANFENHVRGGGSDRCGSRGSNDVVRRAARRWARHPGKRQRGYSPSSAELLLPRFARAARLRLLARSRPRHGRGWRLRPSRR